MENPEWILKTFQNHCAIRHTHTPPPQNIFHLEFFQDWYRIWTYRFSLSWRLWVRWKYRFPEEIVPPKNGNPPPSASTLSLSLTRGAGRRLLGLTLMHAPQTPAPRPPTSKLSLNLTNPIKYSLIFLHTAFLTFYSLRTQIQISELSKIHHICCAENKIFYISTHSLATWCQDPVYFS